MRSAAGAVGDIGHDLPDPCVLFTLARRLRSGGRWQKASAQRSRLKNVIFDDADRVPPVGRQYDAAPLLQWHGRSLGREQTRDPRRATRRPSDLTRLAP